MRLRCRRGFTLVELLVVVAIIVLVAGFASHKVHAAVNNSREARVQKDLRTIHDALERHYADRGHYPKRLGDLVTRGYLREGFSFKSPVSGYYYFYAVDDNYDNGQYVAKSFVLGAPLRNAPNSHHLTRGGPIPRGRQPDWTALAWFHYNGTTGLVLYTADDSGVLPDPLTPLSLADYRTSCQSPSAQKCDLWSN